MIIDINSLKYVHRLDFLPYAISCLPLTFEAISYYKAFFGHLLELNWIKLKPS
jgi:hypothetical protein